jgi:hypothetical protein
VHWHNSHFNGEPSGQRQQNPPRHFKVFRVEKSGLGGEHVALSSGYEDGANAQQYEDGACMGKYEEFEGCSVAVTVAPSADDEVSGNQH